MTELLELKQIVLYPHEERDLAYEDYKNNIQVYDFVSFEYDSSAPNPKDWKYYLKYYNKVNRIPSKEEIKNSSFWGWKHLFEEK